MLQTFQKYKMLPSSFYESPILYTSIKRHFKKWNFLSVPIINMCIIDIWTCIAYPETCANNSTRKLLVKNVELVWHSKPLHEAPHAQTKRQHLCERSQRCSPVWSGDAHSSIRTATELPECSDGYRSTANTLTSGDRLHISPAEHKQGKDFFFSLGRLTRGLS